jgi:glycosyltransferase involved in cell wall biosynthesis
MTKISVITATYNCKTVVADALASVFSQTGANIETVVVDGASTDGTRELLEGFRPRLDFLISEPDKGIYDALNKGIRHAQGDVIGFLHSDDLFENEQVLHKISLAFADPSVEAVYGDLVYVRKDDPQKVVRYWKSGAFDRTKLRAGWMPPHPTFYVRRSVYERLGAFDTRYRIAADYDSIVRLLFVANIKTAYIPEVLVRMRIGGASNRSLANILRKSREDYAILRSHDVGGLRPLIQKNVGKLSQLWDHSSN